MLSPCSTPQPRTTAKPFALLSAPKTVAHARSASTVVLAWSPLSGRRIITPPFCSFLAFTAGRMSLSAAAKSNESITMANVPSPYLSMVRSNASRSVRLAIMTLCSVAGMLCATGTPPLAAAA